MENFNHQQISQHQKSSKKAIVIILIFLLACGNISLGTLLFLNYKKMSNELDSKQESIDKLQEQYDELLLFNMQLESDYESLESENGELNAQIDELTSPVEETGERETPEELDNFINSNTEDVSAFRNDISYDEIARYPDKYDEYFVTYSGEVVQVIEGNDTVDLRIAIDGDYDKIVYGVYDKRILESRILEYDNIQFYGQSCGIISYESTFGATISIPSIAIYKIELK